MRITKTYFLLILALVAGIIFAMQTSGSLRAWAQDPGGAPPSAGPRVKLVIPGQEPMLIDTAVAGDVVLVLQPDGQGVQVKSDQVDITLTRGTQPGSIAMSSPLGGTFEMQGQFAWMKDGRNVLLAAVGGSPNPLSSGGTPPAEASSSPSPAPSIAETAAVAQPDTAAEAQRAPIQIVDNPNPIREIVPSQANGGR